jgi:H/ACA ribonucleoprotein complex subunit 4
MNKALILKKSIVFADKPAGITSFDLVSAVKEELGAEKAGHSGTLDPLVTGVMMVALNEATKAMPVLMGLDKEYEGVMHLHSDVEEDALMSAVRSFTGKITQTPPRRSAVKREPREREIYAFDVLSIDGREVSFRVRCQSGTYIRKLCSDIGERLGCGAHMAKLRRTKLGPFTLEDCKPPGKLAPGDVIPLESILDRLGIRRVLVKEAFRERVMNGNPLGKDWVEMEDPGIKKGDYIAIYLGSELAALGTYGTLGFAKIERLFGN